MRVRRICLSVGWVPVALCLCLLELHRTVLAVPDDAKARDAQESEETTGLIKAELPNWRIWKGNDRQDELQLESKSVLRWTNPGSGRVYGDLYFWTAHGRPEVVMSIFKAWDPPNGFHAEMHSLSLETMEADRNGKTIWAPSQPGITLRDVPSAPQPADSAVRRLSQMRTLALEFEAVLTDKRRNDSGERQSLRLLTQPLHRYQSSDSDADWIDGAVFGFVMGTDPEAFVLLEARRSGETTKWQYGLARMNNDAMVVTHNRREVWRIERQESQDWMREPYLLTRVPETP